MSLLQYRLIWALALVSLAFATAQSWADDSGIDILGDKRYLHPASRMSLRIGPNWQKIYEPYRPRRTGTTSVLGMEQNLGELRADKQQPKNVVMIYFAPMGNRPLSDIVNASEKDDKLGEEYNLLATVYGKDRIERPVIVSLGEFKVFKIVINAGPDNDLQGAGVMYIFQVGRGEDRWRIKVRGTFPVTGKEQSIKVVEGVVQSFKPEVEMLSPELVKELDARSKGDAKKEGGKEVLPPPAKEPTKKIPQ